MRLSIFILLLFTVFFIYSEDTSNILKVVNVEAPPLMSENMPYGGPFLRTFIEDLSEKGFQFDLLWRPLQRVYYMIKKGDADLSFGWIKTKERLNQVKFSDSVFSSGNVVFYLKKNNFDWNEIKDLYGLKVGLQLGTVSYGSKILEAEASGKIEAERVGRFEQNIRKLLSGRLDIVIGNKLIIESIINHICPEKADLIAIHEKEINFVSYHIIFRKDISQEIINIFNEEIRKLKTSGKIQKILTLGSNN